MRGAWGQGRRWESVYSLMKIQNDGWSWRRVPRRCIISTSPELARIASRRRGLIIHAVMIAKRRSVAKQRSHLPRSRRVATLMRKGCAARAREAGTKVVPSECSGWNSGTVRRAGGRAGRRHPAATRAAWGEGRGAGIPLPPRRRHVKNLRVHLQPAWHFAALLQQTTLAPEWSVTHRPPGRAPSVRWVCILRWCV